MNFSQSTGIVYDRIRELEPKIAGKIIGVLLMLDYGEREMIRLAFGPNRMIEEVVQEARVHLQGGSRTMNTTVSPTISSSPPNNADKYTPLTSCNATLVGGGFSSVAVPAITYWTPDQLRQQLRDHQQQVVLNCNSSSCNVGAAVDHDYDPQVQEGNRGGSNGFSGECFYSEATVRSTYANRRTTTCRSLSLQPNNNNNNNNFSTKICHYYSKGFCKHGSNCRYMHSNSTSNSHGSTGGGGRNGGHNNKIQDTTFIEVIAAANKFNNGGGEDHHHHHHHHGFTQGTLDKLEAEIIELLKSTRGNPISIASLPMVYQEKYGRSLQAEGYLTESQRHGRSGYSLTKLLARLKSIRLFDRPHGQHFVILAEDASKYSLESYNERKDPGPIVAGSRQIYLTFPAESTFSEEDVSNYFSFFGKVEDVRIPNQDKRMFGFVTFSSSSTVRMILGKGNPHFVCGARVLVKPYREKPKLCERKYMTKNESHLYQHHQGGNNNWDFDHEAYRTRRRCEAPRFWRRHLLEEQEWALELDRRRLSELKLARKPFMATVPLHHSVNHSKEQLNPPKEHSESVSAEEVNHLLDVFSNGSTSSDDPSTCPGSNCSDQESPVINLPDSPFAYQAAFITAT